MKRIASLTTFDMYAAGQGCLGSPHGDRG